MAKMSSNTNSIVLSEHRLDRIEQKIDKLAEAIVSIARAEEKLVSLETAKQELQEQVIKVEERVTINEKKTDDNTATIGVFTRVFWIGISAVIVACIGAFVVKK